MDQTQIPFELIAKIKLYGEKKGNVPAGWNAIEIPRTGIVYLVQKMSDGSEWHSVFDSPGMPKYLARIINGELYDRRSPGKWAEVCEALIYCLHDLDNDAVADCSEMLRNKLCTKNRS